MGTFVNGVMKLAVVADDKKAAIAALRKSTLKKYDDAEFSIMAKYTKEIKSVDGKVTTFKTMSDISQG